MSGEVGRNLRGKGGDSTREAAMKPPPVHPTPPSTPHLFGDRRGKRGDNEGEATSVVSSLHKHCVTTLDSRQGILHWGRSK
jgi:hypothetical protein